jgi:alcohol dehydrogenase YqhD (iron-dependent ADH family)
MEDPEDIDARATLSMLGAIALHGFINRPRGGNFPLHQLQHPLSAYFDISHGRGLALLLPRWLKFISHEKPDKIIQLGDRVFAMDLETYHPFEAADKVIIRITEWLEDIGAWFFMDNLGIPNDPSLFEQMADDVLRVHGVDGMLGGVRPLSKDDIVEIYRMCVRIAAPVTEAFPEEPEDEETPEGDDGEEVVEVVEEVIEIEDGEELPEGVEGEEIIVVEEVVEVEEEEKSD